jgi:hypothetical protein
MLSGNFFDGFGVADRVWVEVGDWVKRRVWRGVGGGGRGYWGLVLVLDAL